MADLLESCAFKQPYLSITDHVSEDRLTFLAGGLQRNNFRISASIGQQQTTGAAIVLKNITNCLLAEFEWPYFRTIIV